MKIVYCINSINPIGGQETITLFKANALVNKGVSVWIVYTERVIDISVENSPSIHFIDLGIRYNDNQWPFPLNIIKRALKQKTHIKKLTSHLRTIQPDIVISTENTEFPFLPSIKGEWRLIREYHFAKEFRKSTASSFREKLTAWGGDLMDSIHYAHYDRIVILTEAERRKRWMGNDRVRVIPNPVRFISEEPASLDNCRVIAIGRLVRLKNFTSLIRAFKIVNNRFPEWRLDIFGAGPEESLLRKTIIQEQLTDSVRLNGFSNDIQKELRESSILVSSSITEGFGLVLVEAMGCGLPVVSYDCPYGPEEIISDGKDGFLVPLGDEKGLAERICLLIENKHLREQMGSSAFAKSQQYGIDSICERWLALFRELLNETD